MRRERDEEEGKEPGDGEEEEEEEDRENPDKPVEAEPPKAEEKKVVKQVQAVSKPAKEEKRQVKANIPQPGQPLIGGQKMENMPFDEAIDVSGKGFVSSFPSLGSDSVESGKEEDDKGDDGEARKPAVKQGAPKPGTKGPVEIPSTGAKVPVSGETQTEQVEQKEEEEEDEEEEEVQKKGGMPKGLEKPGAAAPVNGYNPMEFASLSVSTEVSELFQHITRYHPHNIELETKLKPFIPDYIPAVGEVDAFLKVTPPEGDVENLGLMVLVGAHPSHFP